MPVPEPLLTRGKVIKLDRLLDMLYTPAEIASELGVVPRTILRGYIPAGAPVVINENGRKMISGKAFAAWAREYLGTNRRGERKNTMGKGMGYCLRCKKVVVMQHIRTRPHGAKAGVIQISGTCPDCGARVNRFARGGGND
jgi:hypothetical protein